VAEGKYDKYFVEYQRTPLEIENYLSGKDSRQTYRISHMDDSVIKGSFVYSVFWVFPHSYEQSSGKPSDWWSGKPPHMHKEPELLFHIGTNPDDPADLGAEVVFYIGPELEKHVITRSMVVYLPPNLIHGPWKPVKTWRPWLNIQINQGPELTIKHCLHILPEEIVAKMDKSSFIDRGF
jgi:hypothetical protein